MQKYTKVSETLQKYENKPVAQAAGQTLHDATPPVGKIHPFSKITVTFEPIQRYSDLVALEDLEPFGRDGDVKIF